MPVIILPLPNTYSISPQPRFHVQSAKNTNLCLKLCLSLLYHDMYISGTCMTTNTFYKL
jgi:hypothetical protein